MEEQAFVNLQAVLQEFGAFLKEAYQENLGKMGKNASKELRNTVTFQVKHHDHEYEVGLDLAYYWKFVEGGTKGSKYPTALCRQHFPPISPILQWIKVKPIIPRPSSSGKIPKLESLAFLIARKISREGIKPAPVLATSTEQSMAAFEQKIQEAFQKDTEKETEATLYLFSSIGRRP